MRSPNRPRTIWRLRGSTNRVVECSVAPTTSTVHAITVVLGSETFLNECYWSAASAERRAMQVRDDLLKGGGWTIIRGVGRSSP
jgi:hypothetical protein